MEQSPSQEVQIPVPIQDFRHDIPDVREFNRVVNVAEYIRIKIAHQQTQLNTGWGRPGKFTPVGFRRETAEQEASRLRVMLVAIQRGETRGAKLELEKDAEKMERMKYKEGEKLEAFPENKEYHELDKKTIEIRGKLPDIHLQPEEKKALTKKLWTIETELGKTPRGKIEMRIRALASGVRKLKSLQETIAPKPA